jgi:8-hydroxy-5-deazaflavin:NADPH oxidoreductase
MKVAILGTGVVGRTLGAKIASLGLDVALGTRDVDALMSRTDTGAMTPQTFAEWAGEHPDVKAATFSEAASGAEIVFNATNGAGSLEALRMAGAENLGGKILIDTSNALDFSAGFPPSLFVSNTDSLAEQIQREFSQARVVKSLNTVSAPVMVDPKAIGGGDHHIFVCGNDQGAKDEVAGILGDWFGWEHVLDIGDLTAARGAEAYVTLWLRMMMALGSPMFNIRVSK